MIDDGPGDLGAHHQTPEHFFFLWRGGGEGVGEGGGHSVCRVPTVTGNSEK